MIAYLIYHGTEEGTREDCSIFYEIPEVIIDDKVKADARVVELEKVYNLIDTGYVYMRTINVGDEQPTP